MNVKELKNEISVMSNMDVMDISSISDQELEYLKK